MVVVLILGVLMAIAIPTFLSLTSTSKSRAAQANLRLALTSEKIALTNGNSYLTTTAVPGDPLQAIDPGLPMGLPEVNARGVVGAQSPPWSGFDTQSVGIAVSDGTKCWYLYDGVVPESGGAVPAGTFYSQGPADGNGDCVGAIPPTGAPTSGSAGSGTALQWYTKF
jgi:type II secretory pathway pseudopilin PulG